MVGPTKKRVAAVLDLYQKSSKEYFPELTELLKKKNEDIFREFHCLCQLGATPQEPV